MRTRPEYSASLIAFTLLGCVAASPPAKPEKQFKIRSNPPGAYIHVPNEYPKGNRFDRIGMTPITVVLSRPLRIAATRDGRIMWLDIDPAKMEMLEFDFTEASSRITTPDEETLLNIPARPRPQRNAEGLYPDERRIQILGEPGLAIHAFRLGFGPSHQMTEVGVTPCDIVLNVRHGDRDAFAIKDERILFFTFEPDIKLITLDFTIARQATADEIAIAGNRVRIGMASAAVIKSWGVPTKVDELITAGGKHETWIYRQSQDRTHLVSIDNGVVTAISTH